MSQLMLIIYFKFLEQNIVGEINDLKVINTSNKEEFATSIFSKYKLNPIKILEINPIDLQETTSLTDLNNIFGIRKKDVQINLSIKCKGSIILIKYTNYIFSLSIQYFGYKVENDTILASIRIDEYNFEKYQSQLLKFKSELQRIIKDLNRDVKNWNQDLKKIIEKNIELRLQQITLKNIFTLKLGLNSSDKSNEELPVIFENNKINAYNDEIFEAIIQDLFKYGRGIERHESNYIGKGEEDLRNLFLMQFDSKYEFLSVVGEATNKNGKADLLFRNSKDGSNVLIVECKFWGGKEKFPKAINQLLGYLTHRDTKSLLMIFVKNQSITEVKQITASEILKHEYFLHQINVTNDRSTRYAFKLPEDEQKEIIMEVMLFHFPKTKKPLTPHKKKSPSLGGG